MDLDHASGASDSTVKLSYGSHGEAVRGSTATKDILTDALG